MSVADRRGADVSNTLTNLSITQSNKPKSRQSKAVADNWDDESSDTETESALPTGQSTGSSAPPPTPLTPNQSSSFDSPYAITGDGGPMTPMRGNFRPDGEERRPEKTTSTAARMIAAGLGVRPPKKTEEMKRYEKAARDKEEKKIRDEKDEKLRAEEAKRAAWED